MSEFDKWDDRGFIASDEPKREFGNKLGRGYGNAEARLVAKVVFPVCLKLWRRFSALKDAIFDGPASSLSRLPCVVSKSMATERLLPKRLRKE